MAILNSVLDFFVTNAYAAGEAMQQPRGAGNFTLFFIMIGFLIFIYLTVWRPQNKRAQEQKEMINGLKQGDEVVTIGGILGKVSKLTDNYIVLSAADNTELTVQKSAVSTVLPKGTLKSI